MKFTNLMKPLAVAAAALVALAPNAYAEPREFRIGSYEPESHYPE